ncbi:MAG: hypothetical protein WBZ51_20150, partial [Xanthobacteraceae bacterium]
LDLNDSRAAHHRGRLSERRTMSHSPPIGLLLLFSWAIWVFLERENAAAISAAATDTRREHTGSDDRL